MERVTNMDNWSPRKGGTLSYYKDLLSGKADAKFLIQANQLGEMVISKLDTDGKVTGFSAGKISEVIGYPLKEVGFRIEKIELHPWKRSGRRFDNWKQWVEALNSKKRSVGLIEADILYRAETMRKTNIEEYIKWDEDLKKFVLTKKGSEYDRNGEDTKWD